MVKVQVAIKITEHSNEEIRRLSEEKGESKSKIINELLEIGLKEVNYINISITKKLSREIKSSVSIDRSFKQELEELAEYYDITLKELLPYLIEIGLNHYNTLPSINENLLENITINKLSTNIGVYSITNTVTGRMYISGSKDIIREIWRIRKELQRKINLNKQFQEEFNQYGIGSYEVEILEECSEEELFTCLQKHKIKNSDKNYPIDRGSSSNIYRVIQRKTESTNQGFVWAYSYPEYEKVKVITSVNLYVLKKKVLERGLPWFEYNEKGTELVEKDKEKYLDPNYRNYSPKNKSGFYRTYKTKEGYWIYAHKEGDVKKRIYSKNIYKLKLKVLERGLPWEEFTEEAKQIMEIAKNEYYGQSSLDSYN